MFISEREVRYLAMGEASRLKVWVSNWHQASIAAFQSRLCLGFVEGVGKILHHGYGHKHFCFSGLTYCSLNQVKIAEEHETLSNHLHSTMFVEWIKDGPDYGFYATVYCCEQDTLDKT